MPERISSASTKSKDVSYSEKRGKVLLTGPVAVFVELIVDPFGVFAHLGDFVRHFEDREAKLQLCPVVLLLKEHVWLDGHEELLLDLFVVFERDLELVHEVENPTIATPHQI